MMVDPLNAPTVQRPDYNDHPTVIRKCIDVVAVTPSVTGFALVGIMPTPLTSHDLLTLDAAGVVTAVPAAISTGDYAALVLEYTSHRVLATVIEVEYIGPATSGSGYVNIVGTPALAVVGASTLAYVDEAGSSGKLIDGAVYVKRFHSEDKFTSLGASSNSPDWFGHVAIMGAANITGSVVVKITRLIEFTPSYGKLSFASATSTPVDMNVVHAAANITGPSVSMGTGQDGYSRIVAAGETLAGFAEAAYGLANNPAARGAASRIAGLLMAA